MDDALRRLPILQARIALAGAAVTLLVGAAGAQAASNLIVCTESSPDGFDIVQYESAVTNDAAGLTIYDQLLRFKPGSTELIPGLAESWRVSADGRIYTLQLRKGVKFHTTPWFKPTRDFNADDVLWSINRINDKTHPAHAVARGGYIYWQGMGMAQLLRSVEKVDAYTVRITLARAEAPFLANLAMPPIGSIYPAEYGLQLQKAGRLDQLNSQPVGSGPFVFKSYQKDAVIRYTAHAAYWDGAPKIDNLIFAITNDPNVRVQRLKAGECQIGIAMKPDLATAFDAVPEIRMIRSTPLITSYIAANAKHPPLDDPRFREALWLAYDSKSAIASVYGGHATPAGSFLPPGIWSHDASLAKRFDPEKARALVKASRYDGRELSLYTRIGGSIDGKRAAELMQSDWARAGIKVKVQMIEWGELLKRTAAGEHDITFLSWAGDNGDPDNFMTPNLSCAAVASGGNKGHWCNPAFDRLIDEARRTTDIARRSALYKQAQRLVFDEAGVIPTVYPEVMTAVSQRVDGFVASPFAANDFRRVSLR